MPRKNNEKRNEEGADAAPCSGKASPTSRGAIIVIRHGERLDYLCRDSPPNQTVNNWIPTTPEPWNPPLTRTGCDQARSLGRILQKYASEYDLPGGRVSAVYSSPLLRCIQTAAALIRGYETAIDSVDETATDVATACGSDSDADGAALDHVADGPSNDFTNGGVRVSKAGNRNKGTCKLKIKIEPGLIESLNEDWYSSWCLPDSDSTWGFYSRIRNKYRQYKSRDERQEELLAEDGVHPMAKLPVWNMLHSVECNARLHLQHDALFRNIGVSCTSAFLDRVADAYRLDDSDEVNLAESPIDLSYTTPFHSIAASSKSMTSSSKSMTSSSSSPPYQWGNFESCKIQSDRCEFTVRKIAESHPNETVAVISHGCPVTTLFERLTGKHWTEHGTTKYTCCSIYKVYQDGDKTHNESGWLSFQELLVNDASHLVDEDDEHAGDINYM